MTKFARNASMAASIAVLAGTLAFFAGPAHAAKVSATISLAGQSGLAAAPHAGGTVSFAVSATAVKQSDLYYLWVANLCYQNGNLVSAKYLPVQNPGPNGLAGSFSLDWSGGGAAQCTAYVWMFPQSSTPLKGALMTYTVSA
jgi:hypothetical protein